MMGPIRTTEQAAGYCGLSYQYFRALLSQGVGPFYYKNGAKNAFTEFDLDAWLETRLVPISSRDAS